MCFLSPKRFDSHNLMVMMCIYSFGSMSDIDLATDWSPYANSSRSHWLTVPQYSSDHLSERRKKTEKIGPRPDFSCVIIARIDVLLYSHNMILPAKSRPPVSGMGSFFFSPPPSPEKKKTKKKHTEYRTRGAWWKSEQRQKQRVSQCFLMYPPWN